MATENRGPQVQAAAILFIVLSWVSVSLRCYVRIFMTRRFQLDDWLAALSLVVFTVFSSVVLLGVATGTGRHSQDITLQDISNSMKWWYFGELLYTLSTWLIKLCIAVFLMQICSNRYHRLILWSIITIFTTYTIVYFFIAAFQCYPVSYFWTRYFLTTGACLPSTVVVDMTYTHSFLNVVADWTLGVLPAFLIRNLNMTPRTKISVAIILGIGAIGSTATIIRIPYISHLTTGDFLYRNTDLSIWSTVEVGLGLTASSMACLKPLFRVFLLKTQTLTSHCHGSKNQSPPPERTFLSNKGTIKSNLTNSDSDGDRSGGGSTDHAGQPSLEIANMNGAIELTQN